jgi:hypothetical protein
MPWSIHALERFNPYRCPSFGSVGSVTTPGASHSPRPSAGGGGRKARSQRVKAALARLLSLSDGAPAPLLRSPATAYWLAAGAIIAS